MCVVVVVVLVLVIVIVLVLFLFLFLMKAWRGAPPPPPPPTTNNPAPRGARRFAPRSARLVFVFVFLLFSVDFLFLVCRCSSGFLSCSFGRPWFSFGVALLSFLFSCRFSFGLLRFFILFTTAQRTLPTA